MLLFNHNNKLLKVFSMIIFIIWLRRLSLPIIYYH